MATVEKAFIIKDDLVIDNAPGRQFVIPVGFDADRPGAGALPPPLEGTLRLNKDRDVVETYSKGAWQSVASSGDAVNAAGAEEIALLQSIIYG